jgi:hypothetical protein
MFFQNVSMRAGAGLRARRLDGDMASWLKALENKAHVMISAIVFPMQGSVFHD